MSAASVPQIGMLFGTETDEQRMAVPSSSRKMVGSSLGVLLRPATSTYGPWGSVDAATPILLFTPSPKPGKYMRKRLSACHNDCCARALRVHVVLCVGEKAMPSSRQLTPSTVEKTL